MTKQRRSTLACAAITASAGVALLFASVRHGRDAVLYNASPSMPIGLYARTNGPVLRGAIVTVFAVDVAPDHARERGFADAGDRFIKRVAAVEGDRVCAENDRLSINGSVFARRRERDSAGRRLPAWSGCSTLSRGDVLLLGDAEDSFDGRYWGPILTARIEGVWSPIKRTGP